MILLYFDGLKSASQKDALLDDCAVKDLAIILF